MKYIVLKPTTSAKTYYKYLKLLTITKTNPITTLRMLSFIDHVRMEAVYFRFSTVTKNVDHLIQSLDDLEII